jgi:hypothetical protein
MSEFSETETVIFLFIGVIIYLVICILLIIVTVDVWDGQIDDLNMMRGVLIAANIWIGFMVIVLVNVRYIGWKNAKKAEEEELERRRRGIITVVPVWVKSLPEEETAAEDPDQNYGYSGK